VPKVIFPIASLRESVTRPVVFDIVRQVMEWSGIPNTTKIQYDGETDRNKQPGSSVGVDEEFNAFGTDPKWYVELDETAQATRILSTAVYYDDNPHVYYDDKIRAYIKPVYVPVDARLSITHRFTDHDSAQRWIDGMRTMISANRESRLFTVTYSYLIPKECMALVKELHRLRENVAGYGQDLDTYIKEKFTKKATIVTNAIGNNPEWAIAETQGEVVGYFEIEGEPEKGTKDSDHSGWNVNFSFLFKYDRPESCEIEYPLMIHNQLLSSKYRPTEAPAQVNNYQSNYSISSRALASMRSTRSPSKHGLPGISIPSFDEFIPAEIPPNTLRLVTALTSIDQDNPLALMTLTDFDDYKLTPEVLSFLNTEYPYLCKLDRSIFNVCVYRFENLLDFDRVEVDSNLMVRLKYTPSLRDMYHVRISVHKNPVMLNQEAKDRLRNNYTVAKQVIEALKPDIHTRLVIGPPLPGNVMTRKDFNNALELIDDEITRNKTNSVYQFNTVMSLLIGAGNRN